MDYLTAITVVCEDRLLTGDVGVGETGPTRAYEGGIDR